MALKGTIAKEKITEKILETFPNSFKYDKEIRIPFEEDNSKVQIKVVLTCAKVNIENAGGGTTDSANSSTSIEPQLVTEQEKKDVVNLLENLGL